MPWGISMGHVRQEQNGQRFFHVKNDPIFPACLSKLKIESCCDATFVVTDGTIMTIYRAISDDKVGIRMPLEFQWNVSKS